MPLKTDYTNDIFAGNRKYNIVDNPDGTKSFIDVTDYENEGDNFGAAEINATNSAVNIRVIGIMENPDPIKSGDDVAGNLLAWIEENGQWEKNEFGALYDGNRLTISGKFEAANFFDSEDVGYRLYRQEDGSISTTIRNMESYYGWVEDVNTAWIGMLGGVDKEFIENMTKFFSMPNYIGEGCRLKVELPASADGCEIRRKTSAWVAGDDITTGDFVIDITDDTNYKGPNDWYPDIGATSNGTNYYYKAFPYKSGNYYAEIGVNETYTRAGILELEITLDPDYVSGSTLLDSAGSNNATMSDCTIETGKIVNAIYGSSGNSKAQLSSVISLSGKALCFWINPLVAAYSGVFGHTSRQRPECFINSSGTQIFVGNRSDGGSAAGATATINANAYNFIAVELGTLTTVGAIEILVNTVSAATGNFSALDGTTMNLIGACNYGQTSDFFHYLRSYIDQFRIFTTHPNANEYANMYQDGAGC